MWRSMRFLLVPISTLATQDAAAESERLLEAICAYLTRNGGRDHELRPGADNPQ